MAKATVVLFITVESDALEPLVAESREVRRVTFDDETTDCLLEAIRELLDTRREDD